MQVVVCLHHLGCLYFNVETTCPCRVYSYSVLLSISACKYSVLITVSIDQECFDVKVDAPSSRQQQSHLSRRGAAAQLFNQCVPSRGLLHVGGMLVV